MSFSHPVFTASMIRYLLSRIGCLMILAGFVIAMVGIAALRSEQPGFDYLLIGVLILLLGFVLWQKLREKQPRPDRFTMLRKRDRREEHLRDADERRKS